MRTRYTANYSNSLVVYSGHTTMGMVPTESKGEVTSF